MSNARLGRRHCVYCRKPAVEVGPLSLRGSCPPCAREAMISNVIQQQTKSGPYHERVVRRKLDAAQREVAQLPAAQAA